ncbi:diguanylate cyclase [Ahrensia sp. R2A130]|uniref:GGDEF domain-containing protein n=1 Tax=Ahrensia sp. R2A130 TaxID=744979 RepID=UPI0001E0F058|nr:GGDEF domain-containing protein [Ahrensia sp. R2A130]EFL90974.1 diguanylate cyclase [Ahrensia sp. R2A130]
MLDPTVILPWLTPIMLCVFSCGFVMVWCKERLFTSALLYAIAYLGLAVSFASGVAFGIGRDVLASMVLAEQCLIFGTAIFALALTENLNISKPRLFVALAALGVSATNLTLWASSAADPQRLALLLMGAALILLIPMTSKRWLRVRAVYRPLGLIVVLMAIAFMANGVGVLAGHHGIGEGAIVYDGIMTIVQMSVNVLAGIAALLLFAAYATGLIDRARMASFIDPLTGLYNRRGFEELSAKIEAKPGTVWIAIGDLDHFKRLNDRHGHPVGDAVLKGVADILSDGTRSNDLVCRFGGEEFLVALVGTSEAEAVNAMNRLREAVSFQGHVNDLSPGEVSMTFGLACWMPGEPVLEVYRRADRALYSGKNNGRNRVQLGMVDDVASMETPMPRLVENAA